MAENGNILVFYMDNNCVIMDDVGDSLKGSIC